MIVTWWIVALLLSGVYLKQDIHLKPWLEYTLSHREEFGIAYKGMCMYIY